MSLLLLLITVLGFVLFFYGIGLWYLALLPIVFLAIFFGYYGGTKTVKVKGSELLQKYSLYIARTIILAGIVGVLNYFGMDIIYSTLWILSLNTFLWLLSYSIKYNDGRSIFQLGFYFCIVVLLTAALALGGRAVAFTVFSLVWVLVLGIVAFIVFVISLYSDIESYLPHLLGILLLGTIILFVFDQVSMVYLAILISTLVLSACYLSMYKILQHKPLQEDKKKEVSVRRILAGERVTATKTYFNSKRAERAYAYISTFPNRAKQTLELMNILLIGVLMGYYGMHIHEFVAINQLIYRMILLVSVSNIFLLKKIGYNSSMQNLVVFFVINFAVYASFFSYFNGNIGSVASRGIIRNVFSASMIFYAHTVPMISKILKKSDYLYWIVASIGAMIVNIILLIQTSLPGELIFFLVLVYMGIQSMILYYAARYIGDKVA